MFKWIKKLFRKKHKVVDFSQLEPNQQIPTSGSHSVDGLGLTNPDSVLSGQNRGTQSIGGSANIQSDPSGQRLVVNDNTTNRVAFGRIGTGVNDWGMKVSKPGFSVDTATADQLIFNSTQDTFKIVSTGTSSITAPSVTGATVGVFTGGNTITIPHGLSITPAFLAYATFNNVEYYPIGSAIASASDLHGNYGYSSFGFTVDATNIYIAIRTTLWIMNAFSLTVPGGTVPVKYYLMQETVN